MSITVIRLLIMIIMIRATSDQINKLALGQLSAIMLLPVLLVFGITANTRIIDMTTVQKYPFRRLGYGCKSRKIGRLLKQNFTLVLLVVKQVIIYIK